MEYEIPPCPKCQGMMELQGCHQAQCKDCGYMEED